MRVTEIYLRVNLFQILNYYYMAQKHRKKNLNGIIPETYIFLFRCYILSSLHYYSDIIN